MSGDNTTYENAYGGSDAAGPNNGQESDLMDASFEKELAQEKASASELREGARSPLRADRRTPQEALETETDSESDVVLECDAEIDDSGDFDAFEELHDALEDELEDEEEMTIVDPLIDKASREADDPDLEDDLDESEFDDDVQFDQLEEFMANPSEDPDDADDLMDLGEDPTLAGEIDPDVEAERKIPKTASQQALEARRAIEERAEARRMERDLNYLDFELDD